MNFEFNNSEEMALYYEVSDVLRKMIEYQDRQFLLDENNLKKAVSEVYKASCSLAKWLRHDHEYGGGGEQGRSPIRREVQQLNQKEIDRQLEMELEEKAQFQREAAQAKAQA